MKCCFAFACSILMGMAFLVSAQSPEERYIQVYNLIQEADAISASGQFLPAITRYKEAQAALQALQTAFPDWQDKVVKYRLGYVASKLETLGAKTAPAPAPAPVLEATNLVKTAEDTAGVPKALAEQLNALQGEIRRLSEANTRLQDKLKEALSAQPATIDPRELAKAEETIRELQKERDLLKASLASDPAKVPKPEAGILEQEKKIVEEMKQKLARQEEVITALRKENEGLKNQNAALQTPGEDKKAAAPKGKLNEIVEQLAVANATIERLQATNTILRAELMVMEKRVTAAPVPAPAPAAPAKPGARAAKSYDSLTAENEVLRARLEVYESKPIPYTAEELAFFKQPDVQMSIVQTNLPGTTNTTTVAGKRTRREPPPGAGPLFAEAQRAAEGRKFEEAEQKFQQVLRQDEDNIFTLSHLAAVQMELKQYEAAEKNLKHALSIDREDPACLFLLGQLKFIQEKYDEALDALSLSASLVPNEFRTQYYLGKTLIQKGNRAQAEKALRKAVQLKPNWGEAHYSLAVVYATQDPPYKELAQWHYQKAIAAGSPRNTDFEKLLETKSAAAKAP